MTLGRKNQIRTAEGMMDFWFLVRRLLTRCVCMCPLIDINNSNNGMCLRDCVSHRCVEYCVIISLKSISIVKSNSFGKINFESSKEDSYKI